jgi:cyclase
MSTPGFIPEARGPLDAPHVRTLAPGVHVYLQPDGTWCLNNAGIITGDGESLLIDTAATRARTQALRTAALTVSPAPITTVVNTHHHGDHTHGNALFASTARIIGHDNCPHEIAAQGDLLARIWPHVAWGEVPLTPPTHTFAKRMNLNVAGITVELEHVPTAHTTNDVIANLPEHGIVFAGDLVFSGGTPFILMGSLTGSLAALERLRSFGCDVIVSGHGPVATGALLDATERYLAWLTDLAEDGLRHGKSPLQAAHDARMFEFATWHNPERLPANLHRAYGELIDDPAALARLGAHTVPDTAAAIADMIEHSTTGRLECHA